jgi:E3 ubiquitin-protein ligase BRE1
VDPSVLQFQNQKLAQQLDVQRSEISFLEGKFSQLKNKQSSYDDTLMIVNRVWHQVSELLHLHACMVVVYFKGLDNKEQLE